MPYVHELADWPDLRWDEGRLSSLLASVRHSQGRLLGRMESLGFKIREEAHLTVLTSEIVQSNAIEGEALDANQVRSSVAQKLGLQSSTMKIDRNVEGAVEMMLDAVQHYGKTLTSERLFGWQACLFPTGWSGMRKITVGGGWWLVVGGWWLVVGGWWLVVGGWWLVVGGWWLVVGGW